METKFISIKRVFLGHLRFKSDILLSESSIFRMNELNVLNMPKHLRNEWKESFFGIQIWVRTKEDNKINANSVSVRRNVN